MLLFVALPEWSTARNICPANPSGFINPLETMLPPRLTAVTWSKVGMRPRFCALLERMHQTWLPSSPPPIKRLPLASTSSVPQTGWLGISIGFIHVIPPSVERLNCLPPQLLPSVLQNWYWNP